MTTMHTEGLWHMRESATHATVTNARGDAVFHDDKRIPGVMADARLIAAAPDLLEAVRRAYSLGRQAGAHRAREEIRNALGVKS